MASGHSMAYVSFRRALQQATALINIERSLPDPPTGSQVPLAEGLRGGSLVLMVASFEGYLRDVFEERLDGLGVGLTQRTFDLLPDRVQTTSVFNLLTEAMHGAPGKSVPHERIHRLSGVRDAALSVSGRRLHGRAFSSTGSNPNSFTVKNLFKQVDYSDVFATTHSRFVGHWGSPVPHDYAQRKLDYVVGARHEIAHGANVLSRSRADLKEAERLMRILSLTLDDALRIHINRLSRV